MMNTHYPEYRTLPAINESFPQFGLHSRPTISLLSPLDLSLRAASLIPITPPSTPSPPRKRARLMSEENYLWRPHAFRSTPPPLPPVPLPTTAPATVEQPAVTASTASSSSYFPHELSYALRFGQPPPPPLQQAMDNPSSSRGIFNVNMNVSTNKHNLHETKNNFEHIPVSQSSMTAEQSQSPTVFVDDETIVLTEDEDETLVSSHGYQATVAEVDVEEAEAGVDEVVDDEDVDDSEADGGEEVYVDVLSNDDDEDENAVNSQTTMRLQCQLVEEELEQNERVLTRNKLVYDDEELHSQAVDGLEKLFDRDFQRPAAEEEASNNEKTYLDLTNYKQMSTRSEIKPEPVREVVRPKSTTPPPLTRTHKPERKRTKLRKHTAVDEETISPVSGTIIRKLRDDEELVVRKGDIDPAFNVVEITEEAKAILASIDNKIGAYLCQLCRTLYDDAFMLAQHRCPRIVHIEYKCSECEKVFNCPANLASHRRWHKPKNELATAGSSQHKKRLGNNEMAANGNNGNQLQEKQQPIGEESADGIYPCPQCGKTFRRHAYLKKHQTSHQMLENLRSLDIFKSSNPSAANFPHTMPSSTPYCMPPVIPRTPLYPASKPYPPRFGTFPFQPFDQRRLYSLGEFYLSQHFERSSAFQYVQANHLRQLSNAANNLLPRPMAPPTMSMPVK